MHSERRDGASGPRDSWPLVGAVQRRWEPASGLGRHAGATYDAAMPAAIAGLRVAVSAEARGLARDATTELTRFDAELGHRVATFAPLLLRSEAASSSQIEHLTASARAILTAEAGGAGGRNATEIVANAAAMTAALELADEVAADRILDVHRVLMADQPRHSPGRWRDEPVWIGWSSESPIDADFVAPPHEAVPALIDDLVTFAQRDDLDPFVQMALAHAQFETIHSFTDGNGRVGRALAQSMLRRSGVTRSVAVPVSAGLLADIDGYHRALTAYRDGDPDAIVVAFAHAAARAVANARALTEDLDAIRGEWGERLDARRSSNAWRLLDVLMSRPVLTAADASEALGIARPNVYPPLRRLEAAGIVQSKREHRLGDSLWRADEVLRELDAFAERAGRRSSAV